MPYRVDNIPILIRPFYLALSWLLGAWLYLTFLLIHKTCRITFSGVENLRTSNNHIFCFWHENLPVYYTVFTQYEKPFVWMNHPIWFMKPIHVLLKLISTDRIVLGSSGHSGRAALKVIVRLLKEGYSTVLNPDGPAGPPEILKRGVLDMSLASGVPVVPVSFRLSRCLALPTWDKKRFPLPFSHIQVKYGNAIAVDKDNYERAGEDIARLMF